MGTNNYMGISRRKAILSAVSIAQSVIRNGGIVIFPTETVYGIGVSYYSRTAKKRLHQLKSRKNAKPFQVLVGSKKEAWRLAAAKASTRQKIEKYWPGPLTAVLPRKGGGTIGLRVPSHPLTLALLRKTGPLYASSANSSGVTAPARLKNVSPLIKKRADIILECPPQPKGVASTVVDFTGAKPRILRRGALSIARDL